MAWWPSSSSSTWLAEQAKEELEILEAQHPARFGYLKLELQNFISTESEQQQQQEHISSASVCTQASSNRKRKSSGVKLFEVDFKSSQKSHRRNSSKGRVDTVIERALACLQKIRQVKRSFGSEEDRM